MKKVEYIQSIPHRSASGRGLFGIVLACLGLVLTEAQALPVVEVTSQPQTVVAGQAQSVTVVVKDAAGAPITAAPQTVTLNLNKATFADSTTSRTAQTDGQGEAEFSGLTILQADQGYGLTFSVAVSRVIALEGPAGATKLDFGDVADDSSEELILTITNSGNATLTVSSLTYPDGFSGDWAGGPIAAYSSQTVTVTFAPTAVQSYTGDITVASDATGSPHTFPVEGEGIASGPVPVMGGTISNPNSNFNGTTVSSFEISPYETTWGEWKAVRTYAAANGYDIGSVGDGCADDHPVHTVSWYDVLKWLNAKSEMEGLSPVYTVSGATYKTGESVPTQDLSVTGYRLPTEAEWEFAARGGNQTNNFDYAGSATVGEVAWYSNNSGGAECDQSGGRGTWPVGNKLPNELGLYDMSGNVWEWTWDPSGAVRVGRGGSWSNDAIVTRVSRRGGNDPVSRSSNGGFRPARTP